MQAVGELDDDHADVLGHRQEHLAQVLDLGVFLGLVRNAREFRHAFDQLATSSPNCAGDLFAGDRRILDDVVQQRCRDRLRVHLQLGENARDRQGVLDVRLARGAALALVGGVGDLVDARSHCGSAEGS